jgi:hypothetical protein
MEFRKIDPKLSCIDPMSADRLTILAKSKKCQKGNVVTCRLARWNIFKPKIPIWVHFGGFYNGRIWYIISNWYILQPFGIFCGHLVYFVWLFGIHIFLVLVCCTKKNLATLDSNGISLSVALGRKLNLALVPLVLLPNPGGVARGSSRPPPEKGFDSPPGCTIL